MFSKLINYSTKSPAGATAKKIPAVQGGEDDAEGGGLWEGIPDERHAAAQNGRRQTGILKEESCFLGYPGFHTPEHSSCGA
jgi:hypothetical protein